VYFLIHYFFFLQFEYVAAIWGNIDDPYVLITIENCLENTTVLSINGLVESAVIDALEKLEIVIAFVN
jgi:hypothetical protein